MLTRELLRFKVADGVVSPAWLRPTPAILDLATRLLDFWRKGVGQRRGDLDDGVLPVLHQSRALVVGRGMLKLIVDRSRFAEAASSETVRGAALAVSADLLRQPAIDCDAHRQAVAERLGLHPEELGERLYGDLPDAAVLAEAPALSERQLIDAYNMGLCQGLLLHARELEVMVHDADTGLRRRLLKALRFRRLLARVEGDERSALRLIVSGPGSVLDQASRYGLQLALFLPALACAREWRASALLDLPRRFAGGRDRARLELSQANALVGDSAFLGHVPQELREVQIALAEKCPDWSFVEPQLLPLPDGELVVPDFQMVIGGTTVAVELFHRWHGHACARRLAQLAQGLAPRLVIGMERALAKTTAIAPLLEQAAFQRHGFLFSDLPVARALREAVERIAPESK